MGKDGALTGEIVYPQVQGPQIQQVAERHGYHT